MTLRLFKFSKNTAVPHQVDLPDTFVFATDEEHARKLASEHIPEIRREIPKQTGQSQIVGVSVTGGEASIVWHNPFRYRHLTQCVEIEVAPGIVYFDNPQD